MRITDENGRGLDRVYLALTDSEAKELRDGLDELVKTREKGWHVHVTDERWSADESERVSRRSPSTDPTMRPLRSDAIATAWASVLSLGLPLGTVFRVGRLAVAEVDLS